MAEAYEVNVAPYNFNGDLGSLISADMCAVAPNFKVMEIDIEEVIWKVDIVTHPPVTENGDLVLPGAPRSTTGPAPTVTRPTRPIGKNSIPRRGPGRLSARFSVSP
jgi:L-alanine-DL-glutamate epimerase-like enolase superfamily enzyme